MNTKWLCIIAIFMAAALVAGTGCGKKSNPIADNKLLMCDDIECLKAALAEGANVDALGQSGDPKLMYAAADGKLDMVKFLVEKGADMNFVNKSLKETALHKAAMNNKVEVVKFFIEKKAKLSPNAANNFTPLRWAKSNGHKDVEKLLTDAGAK